MASCSSCSVQKFTPENRSKSCDTVCSSNSSCYLQRRRPVHPLASGFRTSLARPTGNAVRQRVLSAKLLKLRTLQNQLNDANFHLAELSRENQALKILQKRQDRALSKYEGANADLPRLLQAHEEEIRNLSERNKALRKNVKELNEQIKVREEELTTVKEQLKHLDKLNKDKHLGEREKLSEQTEDMKIQMKKYEDQINMLNRKLTLESKNFKYKLNAEIMKHRQCQRELTQALSEIDKLTGLIENTEKISTITRRRFPTVPKRQAISLVSLTGAKHHSDNNSDKSSTDDLLMSKDVKLEPIQHRKEDSQKTTPTNGILKSPAENVKARLSASLHRNVDSDKNKPNESRSSSSVDNKSTIESDICSELRRESLQSLTSTSNSRPNSSQKLDKISSTLEATIQKAIENGSDEFDLRLGNYCSQVVNTVKSCSAVIENHKQCLDEAKSDTTTILNALEETAALEKKLKQSHLLSVDTNNVTDDNLDFINQILKDEMDFQNKNKTPMNESLDKNGNLSNRKHTQADKKKLLATLRAIDNGDSVESIDEMPQRKSKVMSELFGDLDV